MVSELVDSFNEMNLFKRIPKVKKLEFLAADWPKALFLTKSVGLRVRISHTPIVLS